MKTRPTISAARKAAFQILLAVERGQSHSDDLLRDKAVNVLSTPDRNLATALVLGVLRWQIQLDHQLQALLKRPNAKLDPEILIALRLGAFQLQHLDRIPARAAIDESVELAKQAGHRFASGMVNAVLRKLALSARSQETSGTLKRHGLKARPDRSRTGVANVGQNDRTLAIEGIRPAESKGNLQAAEELATAQEFTGSVIGHDFSRAENAAKMNEGFSPCKISPRPKTEPIPFSAARLAPESRPTEIATDLALSEAHPAWLVERWIDSYGIEAARAICRHGQTQPALTVRVAGPEVAEELALAGVQLGAAELLSAARTVLSGDVTATAAFREGRVRLQDEGSQLVAEIAACSGEDHGQETKNILDACAAPGGKTLILAERNPHAHIVACESSAVRLEQLRTRLAAEADRIECRKADATLLSEDGVFDLALTDVPCSGTGTLGRNPEIRHRLRSEDLPRQAERQRAILSAALRSVRVGGHVVYSTCSLEPEENEQVLAAVLSKSKNARMVSLQSRIDALAEEGALIPSIAERLHGCLTDDGALRLQPGVFHTDGFFIALVERTA